VFARTVFAVSLAVDPAPSLIDVSHQAQIQFSALRFDRATRAFFYEVQITNRSDEPLVAPLEPDVAGVVIRRASRRPRAGRRARPIFVPLDASANILAPENLNRVVKRLARWSFCDEPARSLLWPDEERVACRPHCSLRRTMGSTSLYHWRTRLVR
jgi:hypothetical protein